MNKAFIFDMDGVIVNSEPIWAEIEEAFFIELLGEESFTKIKGQLIGSAVNSIFEHASQNGLEMEYLEFKKRYDQIAFQVYQRSALTNNIDSLIKKLKSLGFKVALVTASRKLWVEQVLPKLKDPEAFDYILSIIDKENLKPKPAPDGYLEAMSKLGVSAKNTIILEDSNKGLLAAKKSGALTICLREHLPSEYKSEGADLYVDNLESLTKILEILK